MSLKAYHQLSVWNRFTDPDGVDEADAEKLTRAAGRRGVERAGTKTGRKILSEVIVKTKTR